MFRFHFPGTMKDCPNENSPQLCTEAHVDPGSYLAVGERCGNSTCGGLQFIGRHRDGVDRCPNTATKHPQGASPSIQQGPKIRVFLHLGIDREQYYWLRIVTNKFQSQSTLRPNLLDTAAEKEETCKSCISEISSHHRVLHDATREPPGPPGPGSRNFG